MAEQVAARHLAAWLRYTRFRCRRSLAEFDLQPNVDGKLFEDLATLRLSGPSRRSWDDTLVSIPH